MPDRDGPRVLVVEDDTGIAALLVEALRDEGYRVAASAGARVVATALADPPDLILLDVLRPGLDGAAVCRRLNADPRTRAVPVVFVTALPEDLLDARTAGCRYAGVISAPFTLGQALATVRRLLAGRVEQPRRARERSSSQLDASELRARQRARYSSAHRSDLRVAR